MLPPMATGTKKRNHSPPTASWGGLLRQAFDNPLSYWHLTFFPGLALFIAVLAFNFTGEGLRKALSPR